MTSDLNTFLNITWALAVGISASFLFVASRSPVDRYYDFRIVGNERQREIYTKIETEVYEIINSNSVKIDTPKSSPPPPESPSTPQALTFFASKLWKVSSITCIITDNFLENTQVSVFIKNGELYAKSPNGQRTDLSSKLFVTIQYVLLGEARKPGVEICR